jgi:hypothetical protein
MSVGPWWAKLAGPNGTGQDHYDNQTLPDANGNEAWVEHRQHPSEFRTPKEGMRINRILVTMALAGLALAMTGCIVTSVYPFYFEKDVAFEPALLGDWTKSQGPSEEHWKFERYGETAYLLTYTTGSDKSSVMQARIFKLRGQTFLDLFASERSDDGLFPTIPSHLLLRIDRTGPTLGMAALNYEWLEELVKKDPKTIRHHVIQMNKDKRIVLTADTRELQKFVIKHLKTEAAWKDRWELQLIPASSPARR